MQPHDTTMTTTSRLAGAVWGHLVGDALGVPYEFGPPMPAAEVAFGTPGGLWNQPAGTWSDDGALMLALLDSLLHAAGGRPSTFDLDDQASRALAWRRDGRYAPDGLVFDIGGTTAAALRRLAEGVAPVEAGPGDERACGNGSLMRILPIGLVAPELPPAQRIGWAHLASRVTHGHARCQVACAVYALIVSALLRGEAPDPSLAWALAENERLYREGPGYKAHLVALGELGGYAGRTGSGFVLDSFWSAWDAFADADSYEDAVRRAVAYGHDTDTTAAIAGGLAGSRFGWAAIPRAWLGRMRGKEIAQPLVDALVAQIGPVADTWGSTPLGEPA